jgi:hypothetical protein
MRIDSLARGLVVALLFGSTLFASGCRREGCLGGTDAKCTVPSPCQKLAFPACSGGSADAKVLVAGDKVPGGLDALGAIGDVRLQNDRVVAVIDALDHPNYLGPSGGFLLDLAVRDADNDGLNHMFQVTGILPQDAVHYTSGPDILSDAGPGVAAVQFRGALDGFPNARVATRYEIRACEPGIRVRTEIVNLDADPVLWATSDGFYWSAREVLPFVPYPGSGFIQPGFNLLTINDVYRKFPFMAASTHTVDSASASYSITACNAPALEGFNSDRVSAVGLPRRIVMPRDFEVYERFVAVARGNDIAPAANIALQVRESLFGEKTATITGRVLREGGTPVGGSENKAAVVVFEDKGGDASTRIPWTQVVPGTDGKFATRVPSGKNYVLTLNAFGRSLPNEKSVTVSADTDVGDLTVPMVGTVNLRVLAVPGGPVTAQVLAYAADKATEEATNGKLFGAFVACTPFLGPQHGPSPACNRILVDGFATVEFPAGNYLLYATIGPFATIERQAITVQAGASQTVVFHLANLPVAPAGTISADLHVHGGASFDSSIPDRDRVIAFLAASMDVIAATDHDVASNYAQAITDLAAAGPPAPPSALGVSRLSVMAGVETTGHILWMKAPGSRIPVVVGHWNFWPVKFDTALYKRGSVDDELVEPGALFDRIDKTYTVPAAKGIRQLNHPWAESEFGRDLGFPRALGLDLRKPLPAKDDGTAYGMLIRTPQGSSHSNMDYDSQEVMNGTENGTYLPYRATWFYLLNQGIVKAATANSDSHGLTDDVLGTPRNLVYTTTTAGPAFDVTAFDDAIRQGRIIGTNGPVIEVTTSASDGNTRQPGTQAFALAPGAQLSIKVTAAPWVPVDEIRIVVNGRVAKTISALRSPQDPFGVTGLVRYQDVVPLEPLLPANGKDAWVIIEAGAPMLLAGDLCPDGVPDTTDNNCDGVVDKKDVDPGQDCGPMKNFTDCRPAPKVGEPPRVSDPGFHFYAVTPGGYPLAFTNPFLLDRDGDGKFSGPGLPGSN